MQRTGKLTTVLPERTRSTLGMILARQGLIKAADAERIADFQRDHGALFGEAAIALKLINAQDLRTALALQYENHFIADHSQFTEDLVVVHDPYSRLAEEYRSLRFELKMNWFSAHRQTLAVASPNRRDGRSYVSANLAAAFSQLGGATLLIDGDLRNPRLHTIFGIDNSIGLAQVLGGLCTDIPFHRIAPLPRLTVLPAGASPPNPVELLSTEKFATLMTHLCEDYACIIIDTPAAAHGADAGIISRSCGGVLAVIGNNRTYLAALKEFKHGMDRAGASIAGAVINEQLCPVALVIGQFRERAYTKIKSRWKNNAFRFSQTMYPRQ